MRAPGVIARSVATKQSLKKAFWYTRRLFYSFFKSNEAAFVDEFLRLRSSFSANLLWIFRKTTPLRGCLSESESKIGGTPAALKIVYKGCYTIPF
jgi:hypothetical protein